MAWEQRGAEAVVCPALVNRSPLTHHRLDFGHELPDFPSFRGLAHDRVASVVFIVRSVGNSIQSPCILTLVPKDQIYRALLVDLAGFFDVSLLSTAMLLVLRNFLLSWVGIEIIIQEILYNCVVVILACGSRILVHKGFFLV